MPKLGGLVDGWSIALKVDRRCTILEPFGLSASAVSEPSDMLAVAQSQVVRFAPIG